MIREFAFGLSNRHHFFPSDNSVKWENVAKDTFLSLYGYDDSVIQYFEDKKTLSGYDGEIYINLHNLGHTTQKIFPGEKVAQLVLIPIETCGFVVTEEEINTGSARGAGGFGSTGER